VGKGGEVECVPQDTIAAKYKAYSKPNSPSHEGAHSSQRRIFTQINIYHIARSGGETININIKRTSLGAGGTGGDTSSDTNSSLGKVAGSDALTFLPDRWLTTVFYGRGHSILFDLSRVARNVGLSCAMCEVPARPRG
jgi:hypothetical protein